MTLAQIRKSQIIYGILPSFPKENIVRSPSNVPYILFPDGSYIIIIGYYLEPVVYICGEDIAEIDANWSDEEDSYIVFTPREL